LDKRLHSSAWRRHSRISFCWGVQLGVRMNIEDSPLIVRFQRLMTEMLVERRRGDVVQAATEKERSGLV